MSKYVVTVLDTTGIQSYIFNSNRLRENIGASYLVEQSTGEWVREKLNDLEIPKYRQHEAITSSGLNAEAIYSGGGNAIVIFKNLDIAKEFTKKLSKHILEEAPGINLVAAHKEFDWSESLYHIVDNLMNNELEQQKRARLPSSSLLGLGVTATCKSTQLPAVNTSEEYIKNEPNEQGHYLVSRETESKLKVVSSRNEQPIQANTYLRNKFKEVLKTTDYKFPFRMDHLGRSKDESSYYAVVHADGNNMGKRFQAFAKKGEKDNPSDPNRGYIDAIRKLSESVNQAGIRAVETVIKAIVNSIDGEGKIMDKFEPFEREGKKYLPFRPLIYGGDDVTFVCDGRLALELAAIYLKALEEQEVADKKPLTACAGICIVKSHYPFARAYQLSEALCGNAKKTVREYQEKQNSAKDYSAIDWHIAASGLIGSIGDIRQREYQVNEGNLNMRPLLIENEENEWRNWCNFTSVVQTFNEKWSRNKVIALREKLREGGNATAQFLKAYRIEKLPHIEGGDEVKLQTEGWMEKYCGYFDAIEAMEFYFPLKQEGDK